MPGTRGPGLRSCTVSIPPFHLTVSLALKPQGHLKLSVVHVPQERPGLAEDEK